MRDYVMDGTRQAKFCIDRFKGFVPQIRDFAVLLGWLVFSSFFWILQPTPLNGLLHKVRRNTSFRVRKCLWGFR